MNPYLQVISINMKMALCIESKITFAEAVKKLPERRNLAQEAFVRILETSFSTANK